MSDNYSNPIVYYFGNCQASEVWDESTGKVNKSFFRDRAITVLDDLDKAPDDCTITINGNGVFVCPRPESKVSSRIPKQPLDPEWEVLCYENNEVDLMLFKEAEFKFDDLLRLDAVGTQILSSGIQIPIARSRGESSIPVDLDFDENDKPIRVRRKGGIYDEIWEHGQKLFDCYDPKDGKFGSFQMTDDEIIESALKIIGFASRIGPKEFRFLKQLGHLEMTEFNTFLISYIFIDAESIQKKS